MLQLEPEKWAPVFWTGAFRLSSRIAGKESNWLQTVPGKGSSVISRLYGPLESWYDKTWRSGEIEMVK